MADPFIAEIRIFGFNFPPRGWAFCNGQLMNIAQNTALFSILGTTYGGNGKTTFGLPDLQGRAPMHQGNGPGLSSHFLGDSSGAPTVTLTPATMAGHPHAMMAFGNPPPANAGTPDPTVALARSSGTTVYKQSPFGSVGAMSNSTVGLTGNDQPHNNLMPYLTYNFCIALQGIFPPRN